MHGAGVSWGEVDQGPRMGHGKPVEGQGVGKRVHSHGQEWGGRVSAVYGLLLLAAAASIPGWLVVCVFALLGARILLRPAQTVSIARPPSLCNSVCQRRLLSHERCCRLTPAPQVDTHQHLGSSALMSDEELDEILRKHEGPVIHL